MSTKSSNQPDVTHCSKVSYLAENGNELKWTSHSTCGTASSYLRDQDIASGQIWLRRNPKQGPSFSPPYLFPLWAESVLVKGSLNFHLRWSLLTVHFSGLIFSHALKIIRVMCPAGSRIMILPSSLYIPSERPASLATGGGSWQVSQPGGTLFDCSVRFRIFRSFVNSRFSKYR